MSRPGRTTFYRGVRMRSRLEADYAAALDRAGATWEYEPHAFADPRGQYLPDFRVDSSPHLRTPTPIYIEVKPARLFDDPAAVNETLAQLSIVWSSEPEATLTLHGWSWQASGGPLISGYGHDPAGETWHAPSWWRDGHGVTAPQAIDGDYQAANACPACPSGYEPQLLPEHDLEAERWLLGAMLCSRWACDAVLDCLWLKPDDFSAPTHRAVLEAIRDLWYRDFLLRVRADEAVADRLPLSGLPERWSDDQPVGALAVADWLDRRGWLAAVGGRRGLAALVQAATEISEDRLLGHAIAVMETTEQRAPTSKLTKARREIFAASEAEIAAALDGAKGELDLWHWLPEHRELVRAIERIRAAGEKPTEERVASELANGGMGAIEARERLPKLTRRGETEWAAATVRLRELSDVLSDWPRSPLTEPAPAASS